MVTIGKMQIRSKVFETNSSSTHSLIVKAISEDRDVPPYVVDGVLIPKNVAIGTRIQDTQYSGFVYKTFEEKVAYIACAINSLEPFMFKNMESAHENLDALIHLRSELSEKLLKGIESHPQKTFHSISSDTYTVELYADYGSQYSLTHNNYTTAQHLEEQLEKLIKVVMNDKMAITDSTIED